MKKVFTNIAFYFKRTDNFLWILTLLTTAYCSILLLSVAKSGNNLISRQLLAITIGYVGAIIISLMDYRELAKHWKIIAIFSVGLLVITIIFGSSVYGDAGVDAKAWLKLPGGLSFQSSELVKICFMITFAKHLSILREKGKLNSFLHIIGLLIHVGVPFLLNQLLGDTGAGIIFFFMFITMSFASGIKLRYFVALFSTIIVCIPFAWNYILSDYQKQRILVQFDSSLDPLVYGYQQIQGKISIGSGGLLGKGLFQGPRVAMNVVPVQESDFIFSVAGEELGFVGCALILLLLLGLLVKTFMVALKSCDDIGRFICFGFFGMIASQAIFNLGMCLSLLPVMGVTLPFFSYGGSSMACIYFGIGLVQSVYMNRNDSDKTIVRL